MFFSSFFRCHLQEVPDTSSRTRPKIHSKPGGYASFAEHGGGCVINTSSMCTLSPLTNVPAAVVVFAIHPAVRYTRSTLITRRKRMLSRPALILAAAMTAGCLGPTMPSHVGPPVPRTAPAQPFTHSIGIQFVALRPGWVESEGSDIQLRRPVLISAHEITNAQYEKFDPKHHRDKASSGDDHPVSNVTSEQADAFCKWLTDNDPAGRRYKLPDLVEWEYAARGGQSYTRYPWGNNIDKTRACYGALGAMPVGCYPPNAFGIFDIAGNVAEWVQSDDFPPYELRGGSWRDEDPAALAITARAKLPAKDAELDHHGFRVLCDPPPLK